MASESAGTAVDGPTRPAVPYPAPDGFRWAAVPDDPSRWRPAEEGKTCRWRGASDTRACGLEAVVAAVHGIGRLVWWNHCGQHSSGRWAEDGKVVHWQLEELP